MLNHKSILNEKSASLFIFIHGRGGNVDVMRPFLRAIPESSNTLFIEAPEKEFDETIGGFSWWQVGHKDRTVEQAKNLLFFIENFIEKNGLNPNKIIGLGFSQGGALLSVCVQLKPNFFSAVAFLASFILDNNEISFDSSASIKPTTKILMIHGISDQTILANKAKESLQLLENKGFDVTYFEEEGVGHKLGIKGMQVLKEWIRNDTSTI